ncbi:MAG: hypothetical protein AB8B55_02860 [Mariniblastus sp.]
MKNLKMIFGVGIAICFAVSTLSGYMSTIKVANLNLKYGTGVSKEHAEKVANLIHDTLFFGDDDEVTELELKNDHGQFLLTFEGKRSFFEQKDLGKIESGKTTLNMMANVLVCASPGRESFAIRAIDSSRNDKVYYRTPAAKYFGKVFMNETAAIIYDGSFSKPEIRKMVSKINENSETKELFDGEYLRLSRAEDAVKIEVIRLILTEDSLDEYTHQYRSALLPIQDFFSGVIFPNTKTNVVAVNGDFQALKGFALTREATNSVIREYKDGDRTIQYDQFVSDVDAQQILKRVLRGSNGSPVSMRLVRNGDEYGCYFVTKESAWEQDDEVTEIIVDVGEDVFGELDSDLPCTIYATDDAFEPKWSVPIEERHGKCYARDNNRIHYAGVSLEKVESLADMLENKLKVINSSTWTDCWFSFDADANEYELELTVDTEVLGEEAAQGLASKAKKLRDALAPNAAFRYQLLDDNMEPLKEQVAVVKSAEGWADGDKIAESKEQTDQQHEAASNSIPVEN